jgi:DNA-binding transcriptional LysR family regulator
MNIGTIDLNLLRVFEAVYRERNLSRAATQLELSQSSVSNALARLRESVGQTLFVRSGHGVIPTPFADAISKDVNQALSLLRNALRDSHEFDFGSSDRQFRIICSDYSAALIIPPLLTTLQCVAPNVSLVTVSMHDGDNIAPALASDDADLALGNLYFLSDSVRHQRLFEDDYVILARKGHPATKSRWNADAFVKYPQIVVDPFNKCMPWFKKEGASMLSRTPHVAVYAASYLSVPYLVAGSDSLAACPRRLAEQFVRGHAAHMLEFPIPAEPVLIRQYWHERQHDDAGHRWLREQIHRVCQAI